MGLRPRSFRAVNSLLGLAVGKIIMLVGTEVVDQMILFSHYASSSASPTSMLMMMMHDVKECHLMMVGTDVVECLLIRHEYDALLICQMIMLCWYVVNMMLCITSNHQA